MYSLLLFVVIVWPTEMVFSINQRIFFPRRRAGERGLGVITSHGGKQRGGHCVLRVPPQVECPEALRRGWLW